MAEPAVVALVKCENYEEREVYHAVKQAVALLGGWAAFIRPEEKLLLKPNLLKRAEPAAAVTTHPAVMKAVAVLLREEGYDRISYGDSPGAQSMEAVARSAGLAQAAAETGLEAADFSQSSPMEYDGVSFAICRGVREADAIINLPKMKTHALERITGAVKNLYGCVGGFQKAVGHTQYPDAISFAGMLAKLAAAVKPRLHIMDGVVAMEGNGPGSGDPVPMKVILASADPYALDQVFCHLIGLDPALVPTNAYAAGGEPVIRTAGGDITAAEAFQQYGRSGFRVDRSESLQFNVGPVDWILKNLRQRPVILKERCKSCRVCVESCPLKDKALKMQGQYPVYDYQACIRCYCCQEMCPHKAIGLHQPWLGRVLAGKWRS